MTQLETPFAVASDPELADSLSNARRRAVVAVLREAAAPLALADLAASLVEREQGPPVDAPDYEAVQQCYRQLYHMHVPKLVEVGLVEFDADRQTVAAAA